MRGVSTCELGLFWKQRTLFAGPRVCSPRMRWSGPPDGYAAMAPRNSAGGGEPPACWSPSRVSRANRPAKSLSTRCGDRLCTDSLATTNVQKKRLSKCELGRVRPAPSDEQHTKNSRATHERGGAHAPHRAGILRTPQTCDLVCDHLDLGIWTEVSVERVSSDGRGKGRGLHESVLV